MASFVPAMVHLSQSTKETVTGLISWHGKKLGIFRISQCAWGFDMEYTINSVRFEGHELPTGAVPVSVTRRHARPTGRGQARRGESRHPERAAGRANCMGGCGYV